MVKGVGLRPRLELNKQMQDQVWSQVSHQVWDQVQIQVRHEIIDQVFVQIQAEKLKHYEKNIIRS